MKTIATIPLSPQKFGDPWQLVIDYDEYDAVAEGPVIWLKRQHMSPSGNWITGAQFELKAEDIRKVRDALDSAAWLVPGEPESPMDSASGEPSAFWETERHRTEGT